MTARRILDQLLQSGQGLMSDLAGGGQSKPSSGRAGNMLSGAAGGLLGGGALAMLLSSKKARKMGGTAIRYGGAAALGALAFRAYSEWQARQAAANAGTAAGANAGVDAGMWGRPGAGAPVATAASRGLPAPQTLDRLPTPEAEQHSRAILGAMIGAAKADGHVGDAERQQLEAELSRLGGDPQDRQWLEAELARPLDPAAVAQLAATPEMAAEMYLASLIVIDQESFMERAYVDELARQLSLAPELQAGLREQLRQAEVA